MKTLVCPISPLKVSGTVVRVTAFMIAAMMALYAFSGSVYFVVAITIDFFIRAFTPLRYSPFSWIACQIARTFKFPEDRIDKAPKMFAARVGFLLALATVVLSYVHPPGSMGLGLLLIGFALLEAVFNLCVGCLVYSYVVLPMLRK